MSFSPFRKIRLKYLCLVVLFLIFINSYLFISIPSEPHRSQKIQNDEDVYTKSENKNTPENVMTNTTLLATKKIIEALESVNSYFNEYSYSQKYEHNFHLLEIASNISNSTYLWEVAAKWVRKDQVTPPYTPLLPAVIHALETSKILSAEITPKGTQLKILLTLEGQQKVLFKPKWYERDFVIHGSVYAGKDRHNGEIAAFHLSRLLGLNRAPIVTGRIVNLNSEILPVASYDLNRTFYKEDNNTCLYGVCMYCKREDGVCGKGEWLEGSMTLWLPDNWIIKKARHPWQRSYSNIPAPWEIYRDYCQIVRSGKPYKDESRLLDLIETSVFDFLIDNGDRHHYEFFSDNLAKVLLIDNAKSFGNPSVDHIDILAPLYQCCRIREQFMARLTALKNGAIGSWLKRILNDNILSPVLSDVHFESLNRRLKIVLSTILVCFQDFGEDRVLVSGY